MAYSPSRSANVSYGAKRVKEAAQLWEPMAKYKIAADTAAQAAAVESLKWGAERRTEALKVALDHHAETLNAMNTGIWDGSVTLDDANLDIYTEAFNRYAKTQRDYYNSVGQEGTDDTITHLSPFFKSIFDDWDKKNPKGDPATLKWGNEDGLWGDVIGKLDPSINRDDAHAVWSKMWEGTFSDRKKVAGEGRSFWEMPWAGGGGIIGGVASNVAGLLPDLGTQAANLFLSEEDQLPPPVGGREWLSNQETMTVADLAGAIKDKLQGNPVRKLPPVFPPDISFGGSNDSKPTTTPPPSRFGGSPGLISGISDFMKGEAIREESGMPKAKDIKTLEKTVKSLEDVETDARKRELIEEKPKSIPVASAERDISQEAASFLAKLLEYMTAYGEEEARVMLSQEFSILSNSAKNELQSHLMTESEALA